MALTVSPGFKSEMLEVHKHLRNFHDHAKADKAHWTDAQWDYFAELYNATIMLASAVELLVRANYASGDVAPRPPILDRMR